MNPEERKLMINIGKQVTDVERRLKLLEGDKNASVSKPTIPLEPLKNGSDAANKFFGISTPKQGTNSRVVCKEPMPMNSDYNEEVEKATLMFKKAIEEFCKEYHIKEFTLQYIDETPKKI